MLDDDEDSDDHIDHLFHPCLDYNVKVCLKMNLLVIGKMQYLLTDHKELKQTKLPDVNIKYMYLIDKLCKLMESCDPGVFTKKCAGIMTSDTHNIPLFSDKVLKDFGEYHNVSIMLRYLMCYFTWCDLSVIQQLLETCGYPDGVRLLNNFKHHIIRSFTRYPIPNPHSLMMPSYPSPYSVMSTWYEPEHSPLSLRHIEVVKSMITKICEVTPQFLAMTVDCQVFHWLIPKSIVPLVVRKAQENYSYLHNYGIKDMSISSPSESVFASDNVTLSLFSSDPKVDADVEKVNSDVDKVDSDVDKVDSGVDKVDSDVDKVDSGVDKVDSDIDKVDSDVDKVDLDVDKVDSDVDKVDSDVDKLDPHADKASSDGKNVSGVSYSSLVASLCVDKKDHKEQ